MQPFFYVLAEAGYQTLNQAINMLFKYIKSLLRIMNEGSQKSGKLVSSL